MNASVESPEGEYGRRLTGHNKHLAKIIARHQRLWIYVIAALLASAAATWAAVSLNAISNLWILVPALVVLSSGRCLTKNARDHSCVRRIVEFYELGILRLTHKWQGAGIDGKEFLPKDHLYASDLDLFGEGSLFELLCTARTGVGRETLANWLINPAQQGQAEARQVAISELREMLDLREYWASVGGSSLGQVGSVVKKWATRPAVAFSPLAKILAISLPICLIVISSVAGVGIFGNSWPWGIAVPIGVEASVASLLLKRARGIAIDLDEASFELALLVPLFRRMESAEFRSPLLKSLKCQLSSSSGCPSKQIRQLRLYVWLLNLRKIEYFGLLSSPILWGTNLVILIERWRQKNQNGLAQWLDSLGQFEALLCLARFYYENPDHTFAVLEPDPTPKFSAQGFGHPLLDPATCVRCDIALDPASTQLLVVSGSNMSGKSTLLRSVGVNCVLALAGAPVCAAKFHMSSLQVACSISVHDSLLQAKSRFQAEVERLKSIITLSSENGVLFLLDELLGGTNSSDRLFGARAVIDRLVANGAIGIVTTHDLALTEVGTVVDRRTVNVHFEEYYDEGQMRFDYCLRPGVLKRTNGLNIMAVLGLLPVPRKPPDTGKSYT